jgi:gluconate 5-dehydrogenase
MNDKDPLAIGPRFSLAGRRALITGSSQGIGLAMAAALGHAGAQVVVNGRDTAKLGAAVQRLRGLDVDAHSAAFDVCSESGVADGIAAVQGELGTIDILVNNAGINLRRSLEAFSLADWHHVLELNLTSAFLVSRAVVPAMIRHGRGKIINTCSLMSELGRATTAPYAASKGGLKMLTKGMCADWAKHGLQVNGIAPGYFRTEMTQPLVDDTAFSGWLSQRTPAGRWGEVSELGGAAVFLASPAADFINGQILFVDGGLSASL